MDNLIELIKLLVIDAWFAWIPVLLGSLLSDMAFCGVSAKPIAGGC
ncbi:MAG: hypothetical protein ACJAT7_001431 [Psychromonas sp.]|jgi:hypothetical protein